MSPPSPAKKNGSSNISQPRQIRFVSTDGQPQTKRRRVTAACRTCRKRKIRCSGEQPVCKTCSDYGHTCLGYNDPPSQPPADITSQSAAPAGHPENTKTRPRARSDSPSALKPSAPSSGQDKQPTLPEATESKSVPLTKEVLPSASKDQNQPGRESPESNRTSISSSNRTHVPYFRYFGPTAIVPGFKQMVVRVRESRKSNPSMSSDSVSPLVGSNLDAPDASLAAALADIRDSNTIPFYDRDDNLPVSNLVIHLCELFFVHLGCSFQFLQRDRFLRDLKEKKIDTILVDAVCALAARFSPHPLLSPPRARSIDGAEPENDVKKSDHGQAFAHRAMMALVDALSCPTLSVVQACLLLAYEEFGSNRDSGLWMYLGISIRMAQDLGLQKLQGLKYKYGRTGLTPKAIKTGQAGKLSEEQYDCPDPPEKRQEQDPATADERARERERVDTFWSIFFLDRVISSGTGRPVTLRDEDIELYFPLQSDCVLPNGWPAPFPPLMRIIHLYGRVTDLINAIEEVNHVTPDTLKRLAGMESDLTGIYQRLSPRLHFNAVNFQTYVRAEEGTNFILLHFWFHTLIVLLHQPTLLSSFGGRIQQLYPNSRELSMSSAKTIADILSFSELIDAKSFIGNPFTSQPMYIAACAFLMESSHYSSPTSKSGSSPVQPLLANQTASFLTPGVEIPNGPERRLNPKHSLLASAAKENYQRCYKALKSLETYWEGTRYILTVLDQKAKGIGDPQLYTAEEMDGAGDILSLAPTGWRKAATRQSSIEPSARQGNYPSATGQEGDGMSETAGSPRFDPSQAIGWALTGATNSSQPNLSLLYQMPSAQANTLPAQANYGPQFSHNYPAVSLEAQVPQNSSRLHADSLPAYPSTNPPHSSALPAKDRKYPSHTTGGVNISDADLLLGLNTPYAPSHSRVARNLPATYSQNLEAPTVGVSSSYHYAPASGSGGADHESSNCNANDHVSPGASAQIGDMMIGTQDIDMNTLQNQEAFPFAFNGELLPWLEYLPQDVLSYFGDHQTYSPLMSPQDNANIPNQRPPQR
ncbi:transcriptional regulator family: Fungal Specific TF [Paecilomyces variotii]|nr:transcriptional regulator family: Fungal Specific TF [Paecilomyces variotii]